ncbi:hypothetical protein [Paracerasibacillus soli]|uniref:Uncharacterized protein n=1 Tax=Paracerasibacillus soli TaxID=480284 RepID=A0ABU5CMU4_9BACI|nr:hypothetical protein [Virgibacillus soli]MDY0407691.1 hypothetical protein [Virgibacillus soli]
MIPYIEHQIPAEDSLSEMNRFEKNVELDNKEDYYEDLAVKIQKHLDWQQIINIMNRWVKK